ncbi:MAG: hypothetical protein ACOC0C_05010 [Bacteroidota bacterium]
MKRIIILLSTTVFIFLHCENNEKNTIGTGDDNGNDTLGLVDNNTDTTGIGDDKDTICPGNTDTLFVGKWELILLTAGFAPREQFNNEKILWEFSSNDSVDITVDTVLSDRSRVPFKTDTTLLYTYDTLKISIGEIDYDYVFLDNSLRLGVNVAADGIMLVFEKK